MLIEAERIKKEAEEIDIRARKRDAEAEDLRKRAYQIRADASPSKARYEELSGSSGLGAEEQRILDKMNADEVEMNRRKVEEQRKLGAARIKREAEEAEAEANARALRDLQQAKMKMEAEAAYAAAEKERMEAEAAEEALKAAEEAARKAKMAGDKQAIVKAEKAQREAKANAERERAEAEDAAKLKAKADAAQRAQAEAKAKADAKADADEKAKADARANKADAAKKRADEEAKATAERVAAENAAREAILAKRAAKKAEEEAALKKKREEELAQFEEDRKAAAKKKLEDDAKGSALAKAKLKKEEAAKKKGVSFEGLSPEEEAKWKDCETAQTLRAKGKTGDADLLEMMAEMEFPGIVERFKASAGASSSAAPTAEDVSAGAAALQAAYDAYKRTEGWLDGIAKIRMMQVEREKDPNSQAAYELEMEISGSANMDMLAYLEVFQKIDKDSSGALSGTEIKDGFMPAVDSAGLGGLLDTAAIMSQLEHLSTGQDFSFADFCALLDVSLAI